MKKINSACLLIIGILLFLISYSGDNAINLFFKNMDFQLFDFILSIVTNFGVMITVMLIIPSFLFYNKNKKLIYLLCSIFIVSFILAFTIKLIVLRQRPMDAFTFPLTGIINYSFPSMHSMVAFSLLPAIIKYLPKQKLFFIIFSFLAAFSRIYFGFHFLSDVVFGMFSGYFIGNYLLGLHEKGRLWGK